MAKELIEIRITAADAINAIDGVKELIGAAKTVLRDHKSGNVNSLNMIFLSNAIDSVLGKESEA